MNILYIWDSDYPWDVRVEKVCRSLAGTGCDVHIAARNLRRLPEHERVGDLSIHRLRPFRNDPQNYVLSFPAFFNPLWSRFLDSVISRNDIELIIVRDLPMAIAGIWAGKRHGIPVILDMAEDYVAMIWDIWRARKFQGLNLVIRNPYLASAVESYVFKKIDHVLAVVDEARDRVIARGGRPDDITIVGNTPELRAFEGHPPQPSPTTERIRGRFSAIYTGGIQRGRGIHLVLEAIPEIVRQVPDFLFVVVGDGYASAQLKQLAVGCGVDRHVLWTGWIEHEQMFELIGACSLGLIPHLRTDHVDRTVPNKIFDYMGMGLPVVASNAIPLGRIIREEACGITFDSGSAPALARAVKEIHSSPQQYGANGRRSVQSKYNWGEDKGRLIAAVNLVHGRSAGQQRC